jgi:hypothetical protein
VSFAKPILAVRIWLTYVRIALLLKTKPLHEIAVALASPQRWGEPQHPTRYARAIHRVLRLGKRRPRCLPSALVLYRLLRAQGTPAELVVGLPTVPLNHVAHAWVEVEGRDVGPPPGRGLHVEMARYS